MKAENLDLTIIPINSQLKFPLNLYFQFFKSRFKWLQNMKTAYLNFYKSLDLCFVLRLLLLFSLEVGSAFWIWKNV